MTNRKYRDITLALAGVYQASYLVNQLASNGKANEEVLAASIASLFKIDAKDAPDVYGGIEHLQLGLREVVKAFSRNDKKKPDPNISRYVLSLILLQQKLANNKHMLSEIRTRLIRIIQQTEYFHQIHTTILANLADVYLNTISSFRFRIQITGRNQHLQNNQNVNTMRALFLAGIRSAVLWRQMGGRRWQLFLARRSILNSAKLLLGELTKSNHRSIQDQDSK